MRRAHDSHAIPLLRSSCARVRCDIMFSVRRTSSIKFYRNYSSLCRPPQRCSIARETCVRPDSFSSSRPLCSRWIVSFVFKRNSSSGSAVHFVSNDRYVGSKQSFSSKAFSSPLRRGRISCSSTVIQYSVIYTSNSEYSLNLSLC